MPGAKLTVALDPDLADALPQAAAAAGTTPEAPVAEAVAKAHETGLRRRVPVERLEVVDARIAAIADLVEQATAPAEADACYTDAAAGEVEPRERGRVPRPRRRPL